MSVENNSLKDLQLGSENKVVGSNSRALGACKSGDRVIITANYGKKKYFTVGLITEDLPGCTLWSDAGGHLWKYNFKYTPLLAITEFTSELKKFREVCAKKFDVNPNNLFNSRFCSSKCNELLDDLLDELTL